MSTITAVSCQCRNNIGIIIIRIICDIVAYLPLTNSKLREDILNVCCYINASILLPLRRELEGTNGASL